ncbi:MAG: FG-GAP repeat protein [Myxococcota bacterium]
MSVRFPVALLAVLLPLATGCQAEPSKDTGTDPGTDRGTDDSASGGDVDGDGYVAPADCDDADATIHPDATDLCGDGVDSDCSGLDTRCGFAGEHDLGAADAKVYVPHPNSDGGRLIEVGDMTGDSIDDLLVPTLDYEAESGGAWVIAGPVHGVAAADTVGFFLEGSGVTLGAGRSTGVGDVNGDGIADAGIGAPHAGTGGDGLYVVLGPITGDSRLEDADIHLYGYTETLAGHGSDLADVDGDGIADAVVGAYAENRGGRTSGAVYVEYGPLASGAIDLTSRADAVLAGVEGDYAGRILRAGGDHDGDGIGDILIQAPFSSVSAPSAGTIYVVYGPPSGEMDLADADGRLFGENPSETAGTFLEQGDVDGDGHADALVGTSSAMGGGVVQVVYGPASGDIGLGAADIIVRGDGSEQYIGSSVAVDDLDGDGKGDLLVGAAFDTTRATGAGAAYLFWGLGSGAYAVMDAGASFIGEAEYDLAGQGVALGDIDGDGFSEVIVGAPGDDMGGIAAGAIYAYYTGE